MAESVRYAIVTGANRGIGLEVCKRLACEGIKVILTSRDQERGLEAFETLKKELEVSDQNLVFHQLDVSDPSSVKSLVDFVKTQFGKLDILINNAGVSGVITDVDALQAGMGKEGFKWEETITQTYESVEECIKINYFGSKQMCEAFIPLLHLSNSPKIVNVSSFVSKLELLQNEWAKGILSDIENLTEEKIKNVTNKFLSDFKEDKIKIKSLYGYMISKACLNGYTRILAKKHVKIRVNSVCPGFVKTDMSFMTGVFLSVQEGASSLVKLALISYHQSPSGCFFDRDQISEF